MQFRMDEMVLVIDGPHKGVKGRIFILPAPGADASKATYGILSGDGRVGTGYAGILASHIRHRENGVNDQESSRASERLC